MLKNISLVILATTFGACSTFDSKNPRGFAGYEFHSGYGAIRDDMERSGYTVLDQDEGNLWFDGTMYGSPVHFNYSFRDREMVGGYIDVLNLSEASWAAFHQGLIAAYPLADTGACASASEFCRVFCTADAKIIHLLSGDEDIHVVRYDELTPQTRCNTHQTPSGIAQVTDSQ